MQTDRLTGHALNYWVAKSLGYEFTLYALRDDGGRCFNVTSADDLPNIGNTLLRADGTWDDDFPDYCGDWAVGGPIIQREYGYIEHQLLLWFGPRWPQHDGKVAGDILLWMMRALVGSVYNDAVIDDFTDEFTYLPSPSAPCNT